MSKPTTNKPARVTKPQPIEIDEGTPVERLNGSRFRTAKNGDHGDLEEETLDRDAPFNKTYGTQDGNH